MNPLLLALACLAGPAAGDPVPPDLPESTDVWPNVTSHANSDEWLWRNHDGLVKLRPRVLVLNFANDVSMEQVRRHAEGFARAAAEATRYHGWEDPEAQAFLEYDVIRYVDLRDTDGPEAGQRVSSTRMPRKGLRLPGEPLIDYGELFEPELAAGYGFPDPRAPERFLDLRELVRFGFVHELWFYAIHDADDGWPGLETCESKQLYDEACRPIEGRHGQAGNGFDRTMPWLGRSFRIAFFNPHRGVGCALENFGHTLEAIANTDSIAYYTRYFRDYADLDLDRRYGLPFPSFYSVDYAAAEAIRYPTPDSATVQVGDATHELRPYVAHGGNVHFPPGAQHHYDLDSPSKVMSTIESWRRRDGSDGADLAREFDIGRIAAVGDLAPDCMGNWIVFWCQCMPGAGNPCLDDEGRPMKSWWPFLFY